MGRGVSSDFIEFALHLYQAGKRPATDKSDYAIAVYEERYRDAGYTIYQGRSEMPIEQHRYRVATGIHEAGNGFCGFINIDGKHQRAIYPGRFLIVQRFD